MATLSSMANLGSIVPQFELEDVITNQKLSYDKLKGKKATVIMFLCNHCPYVEHINPEIVRLVHDFVPKGISFIGIMSNNVTEYTDDEPEKLRLQAKNVPYDFPYLYDESQEVAKAFGAECTPDIFVYDTNNKLAYRGRIDASRPKIENPAPLNGNDIRGALNAIIAHEMISEIQYPSIGCSIKWK